MLFAHEKTMYLAVNMAFQNHILETGERKNKNY